MAAAARTAATVINSPFATAFTGNAPVPVSIGRTQSEGRYLYEMFGAPGATMRVLLVGVLALALISSATNAAAEQRRDASFPMAGGFDDSLTIVSGTLEVHAPHVSQSAGFFRTSGVTIGGLNGACWQDEVTLPFTCVDGPLTLSVAEGDSFGFNPAAPYSLDASADHALVTFVDLAQAKGFDQRLHLGPSAIGSLVGGSIEVGDVPASPPGRSHAFHVLEDGHSLDVRDAAGLLVHRLLADDEPLFVQGSPTFPAGFGAKVVVLPFEDGAQLSFTPAAESAAVEGLDAKSIELLDEILANVNAIGPAAKGAPFAILGKAGPFLTEIFNGAFVRARLADNPQGFGDVGFAKFNELAVESGEGRALDFDGSYTLVVGDLGTSFEGSEVSKGSAPLRWGVGLLLLLAVAVVGTWLWLRDGPMQKAETGPHVWFARVAAAVGVVVAFLVWDWQLNEVLGSSLLTTDGSGSGLGVLMVLELASLALAGLLVGVPVYLATRYGLALAKQPRYTSLAPTAGVFFTIAFGVYRLPALVSFNAGLAA
jgi:hypothetical protein